MTHKYTNKEEYIAKWGLEAYQEFLDKTYRYYVANKEKIDKRKKEIYNSRKPKPTQIISLPEEIWLPVVGCEEDYQVSSKGRVMSNNYNHTGSPRLLKQSLVKGGYLRVSITINGEHKSVKVHRLVAEAFIPNPNNYETVNHRDEVKTNNCVENLEWLSSGDNVRYGTGINRRSVSRKENAKGTKINVFKNGVFYKYFSNVISASKELGIGRDSIFKRIYGKAKKDINGLTFEKVG